MYLTNNITPHGRTIAAALAVAVLAVLGTATSASGLHTRDPLDTARTAQLYAAAAPSAAARFCFMGRPSWPTADAGSHPIC